MALTMPLADDAAIYEFSYTSGNSGVYQLAGAWGGFFTFLSEWPAGSSSIPIRVTDGSANTEISNATYDATANTLTVNGGVPLASTNGGALVNWSGRTRLLVHALVTSTAFPLCPTPPTAGQILVWDAVNHEWCPADLCALVTACLTFTAGAVSFGGNDWLWGLPAMSDSPTFTMSVWLYVSQSQMNAGNNHPTPSEFPQGDLFNSGGASANYIINSGQSANEVFQGAGDGRITAITSANPGVITMSGSHLIPSGARISPQGIIQTGWAGTAIDGDAGPPMPQVTAVSVTSNTITTNVDTTGFPAYSAGSNPNTSIFVANAFGGLFQDSALTKSAKFTTATPLVPNAWNHLLMSGDMNHASGSKIFQLALNDVVIANDVSSGEFSDADLAFSIGYTDPDLNENLSWQVGGNDEPGGGQQPQGIIGYASELWFAPGQFLDLTSSSNRHKFRDAVTGKPISLGTTGSLPTGTAPVIYQTMPRSPGSAYAALSLPVRVANTNGATLALSPGTLSNGITTTHTLTASFWLFGDVGDFTVFGASAGVFLFTTDPNNYANIYFTQHPATSHYPDCLTTVHVDLWDSATNSQEFHFTFPIAPTALQHGMNNVRFAVDMNQAIGMKVVHAYVNNASAAVTVVADTQNNLLTQFQDTTLDFFDAKIRAWIGQIWIAPNQFFDPVSDFIDSGGQPINLGADGSVVTGTAPSFYFNISGSQPADGLATNLGTGGSLTESGSMALLPDAAGWLKNSVGASGKNLALNSRSSTFTTAPSSPTD